MKKKGRVFLGEFDVSLSVIKERIKKMTPDITDEDLELRSREVRNFNKNQLKGYLKGKPKFQYGKDQYGRPLLFDVKQQ